MWHSKVSDNFVTLQKKIMKKVLFILISMFVFASCGKDESWSPEDDIKDFLSKNPYGVTFENSTNESLYITCTDLSANVIIVKTGEVSNEYHTSKSGIIIKYNGEGTRWTEKTEYIELMKDKTTNVILIYP